jgi:hypothetical protein
MTTKVKAGVLDISGDVADSLLVAGTPQATTSGTEFTFAIPTWAKRITVIFSGVSLSGTDDLLVQIGTASAIATTGYVSASGVIQGGANGVTTSSTAGFNVGSASASNVTHAIMTLVKANTSDVWISSHAGGRTAAATVGIAGGGFKDLDGPLTQVRITRSGTNTFDAGEVNVLYE